MSKNMKFTKSTRVSLRFILDLIEGKTGNNLPIPDWKGLDTFFYEIKPGHLSNKGKQDSSDYDRLERKISFFGYRSVLLAEVWLVGNQFTNTDKTQPTFWKVTKVKFRKSLKLMPPYGEADWYEAEVNRDVK